MSFSRHGKVDYWVLFVNTFNWVLFQMSSRCHPDDIWMTSEFSYLCPQTLNHEKNNLHTNGP